MILLDLLKLQTETSDVVVYAIYSNEGTYISTLELIPYKFLIKEISMWEIEMESENKAKMKIWLN